MPAPSRRSALVPSPSPHLCYANNKKAINAERAFVVLMALCGVVDAVLWSILNRSVMGDKFAEIFGGQKKEVVDREEERYVKAMRREAMQVTTMGIKVIAACKFL